MRSRIQKLECFASWLQTWKKLPAANKPTQPPRHIIYKIAYALSHDKPIPYHIQKDYAEYISYYLKHIHGK